MSRRLNFFYDINLEFDCPVREHAFVLRCIPPSFPGQEILDVSLALDPCVPYACQRDGFGNLLQIGRIQQTHSHFHYTVRGSARLDASRRVREAPVPVYRFPSALTAPSPQMEEFLQSLSLSQDPVCRAWDLAQAVHQRMNYAPGETGLATTAAQAFQTGQGVCQDYAHLYLALARQAGLAARYVNGLPEGEGASHAWCEVWLNGVWTGIDPTRNKWTDEGYIRFGVGRDFYDCPIERGIFLGTACQRQTVFMKVSDQ